MGIVNYILHNKSYKRTDMSKLSIQEFDNLIERIFKWEETKMTEEKLNLEFYVAGVKFRKDWKINLEALEEGVKLELTPEPDNRFDPFAVQIHDLDDIMLGYVPAKTGEAKIVSAALKEGRALTAIVVEVSPDFEPWTALKVRITAPEFESDEEVTEDA